MLVDLQNLDVVLIQETMEMGIKVMEELSNFLKDWEFLYVH
jgi:hypothetical protein